MRMKDLELHRWYFFTLRPELYLGVESKRQGRASQSAAISEEGYPLPPAFEQLLERVCQQLKSGSEPVKPTVQRVQVLQTFQRLIKDEDARWNDELWKNEQPPFGVAIDGGVFNDVLFVRASAGYKDKPYDSNQINKLRSRTHNCSANAEQFLGMLTFWVVQVEPDDKVDLDDALSTLQKDIVSQTKDADRASGNPQALIQSSTEAADLVWRNRQALIRCSTDKPHHEIYWMAYRQGSDEQNSQLGELSTKILPLTAIQRLKIWRIYHDYPQVYNIACKYESTLESLMREVDDQLGLARVEQLSHDIARKQKEFLEIVSILEVYNETLTIAQKNINRLLISGQLETASQNARAQLFLAEIVDTALESIQAHICFLSITRNQAELTLESLSTTAGVRNAQWLRLITYIGMPFAAASIIEAFQSDIEALGEGLGRLPLFGLKMVILFALVLVIWYSVNQFTNPKRSKSGNSQ